MKHFSLVETSVNKNKSWKLLDANGNSLELFRIFSILLIKKYAPNTRLSYCKNIALFIDYLEESTQIFKDRDFTKSFLVDIIESFPEWLLHGENSGNEITLIVQKNYPSPNYSRSTINLIMASVRLFLNISERIRLEQEALGEIVDDKLLSGIGKVDSINSSVKSSLVKKSMISGVIANGPQFMKICILPIKKSQSYFNIDRAFPFDKIIPFIESLTSYRDKALYMLCAASGCRIHEALQILIEDIDLKHKCIRLVDPNSRIKNISYKSLTAEERNTLTWKGRQTDKTVLIQPFGDMFFEYLEKYIKNEYSNHNKHMFVFQHIRGNKKGKPFFLSAAATRNEAFNKATVAIGVDRSLNQGVHSLRHMYGTYLVNYFPKSDGSFGLPLAIVQKIMGHSVIDSTQKYARHDKDLMAVELEYANSLLYNKESHLTLLDMKRKALSYQLLELEKEIQCLVI